MIMVTVYQQDRLITMKTLFILILSCSLLCATASLSAEEQRIARYTLISFDVYGPVMAEENLWFIAQSQYTQTALTVNQVMMGLFRFNPGAFLQQNINCLKSGALVLLPPPDQLPSLSVLAARRAVTAHQKAWDQQHRRCAP